MSAYDMKILNDWENLNDNIQGKVSSTRQNRSISECVRPIFQYLKLERRFFPGK